MHLDLFYAAFRRSADSGVCGLVANCPSKLLCAATFTIEIVNGMSQVSAAPSAQSRIGTEMPECTHPAIEHKLTPSEAGEGEAAANRDDEMRAACFQCGTDANWRYLAAQARKAAKRARKAAQEHENIAKAMHSGASWDAPIDVVLIDPGSGVEGVGDLISTARSAGFRLPQNGADRPTGACHPVENPRRHLD